MRESAEISLGSSRHVRSQEAAGCGNADIRGNCINSKYDSFEIFPCEKAINLLKYQRQVWPHGIVEVSRWDVGLNTFKFSVHVVFSEIYVAVTYNLEARRILIYF